MPSLRKLLLFLSFLFICMIPSFPAFADTTVSANITTDTTWTLAGSPYIVTSDISVYSTTRATLTIEPGVTVKFNNNTGLSVSGGSYYPGALKAVGTASAPIIFTSNDSSPIPGNWKGITFGSGTVAANSVLDYVTVEYGGGNTFGNLYLSSASLTVTNSAIQNSSTAGVYAKGSSAYIERSTIANNGTHGIYNYSYSNLKVISSDIVNNVQSGAYTAASLPLDAKYNWWGDPSGPYYATNVTGLGNKVSDNVSFTPWLGESYKNDTTPPTVSIDLVTTPTYTASQTITGTMETNAKVTVTANTPVVAGPLSYPTATTWSCTISGLVAGNNTIVATARDIVGNVASASVTIWLDAIAITSVSTSRNVINTMAFESTTIFFTLNRAATAIFKIVPEKLGSTGAPIYQATQNCPAEGAYFFTWDGHDNLGKVVPDEAYLLVIEASQTPMSTTYSPSAPPLPGDTTVNCTQDSYDPFQNDPLAIGYAVSQPARINVSIAWGLDPQYGGLRFNIQDGDAAPQAVGSHSLDWDGHSPSGAILAEGAAVHCAIASMLGENAVITTGDTVKINSLTADPYEASLSYGQFTKIRYTLSRDAYVTMKLISPSGTELKLFENELQAAGPHMIYDDRPIDFLNASDNGAKNFLVSEEGNYQIWVQAVSPATGTPTAVRGNVRLRY